MPVFCQESELAFCLKCKNIKPCFCVCVFQVFPLWEMEPNHFCPYRKGLSRSGVVFRVELTFYYNLPFWIVMTQDFQYNRKKIKRKLFPCVQSHHDSLFFFSPEQSSLNFFHKQLTYINLNHAQATSNYMYSTTVTFFFFGNQPTCIAFWLKLIIRHCDKETCLQWVH